MKTRTERPAGVLAAAALLLGCNATYPLSEVPIVGGTPETRAIVEGEIAWFADQIAPVRIELSEIRIADLGDKFNGHYTTGRRIELHTDIVPKRLAMVLRHELCHALDFQAELADRPHPAIDGYAARLYDPEFGDEPWRGAARNRRSEALARICEVGPAIAVALAQGCPGEARVLADVAAFARDEIWHHEPQALPVDPIQLDATVPPFEYWSLSATEQPGVLALRTDAADLFDSEHALDLYTGEDLGDGQNLDSAPLVSGTIALGHALEAAVPQIATGDPDRALVLAMFNVEAFGFEHPDHPRERLLYTGPELDGWAGLPRCLPSRGSHPLGWDLFSADSDVWLAERDGEQVWWAPVRGEP